MKKNVKDFLNYLEKETSISVDAPSILPTKKFHDSINQRILVNLLSINQHTLGMAVICSGSKNSKNITGVEVLYGVNYGELSYAESIQQQIMSTVPSIQVELRDVKEFV